MFLDEFIRLDRRGHSIADQCLQCSTRKPEYRCRDCYSGQLLCKNCISDYHIYNPLHVLEVRLSFVCMQVFLLCYNQFWNGTYFKRVTLKSLNLHIQLGHPFSEPCPVPQSASEDSFVIIDSHGIHEVGLDFCGCGHSGTMVQQLLRYRLYPATVQSPSTAATFRALRHFQLLNFEAKCSAYEYFQTLLRETDNTGLTPVKVRLFGFTIPASLFTETLIRIDIRSFCG